MDKMVKEAAAAAFRNKTQSDTCVDKLVNVNDILRDGKFILNAKL